MKQALVTLENAILFLLDFSNRDVEVPGYIPGVATAASDSCVSVSTKPQVDGEVTIRLARAFSASAKSRCQQVFSGMISTPSRMLAVVTSEFEKVLEIEVTADIADVRISLDDPANAGLVLIEAE